MSSLRGDRRFLAAGFVGALVLAGAALFFLLRPPREEAGPVDEPPPLLEEEAPEVREFQLYFPGEDGRLHALAREFAVSPEPVENITHLVEALIMGPHGEYAPAGGEATSESAAPETEQSGERLPEPGFPTEDDLEPEDGLWPPFPPGITLGRAYLLEDATVILDLVSPDRSQPSTGSQEELLMLYSLVNTVLMNVEEAERLVLLWNGRQPKTFAGHVDATRPFLASTHLVAPRGTS